MSGLAQGAPRGAVALVLGAWPRFRASTAGRLAARPDEPALLACAVGACLTGFLGALPGLLHTPPAVAGEGDAAGPLVAAQLVVMLFFGPLLLYGLAALARIGARAAGGRGDWYESRLATFWAFLVAAPVYLATGLATAALRLSGADGAAEAAGGLAFLAVIWIWAACLAEAHGFRSTFAVFLGTLALSVAPFALLYLAAAA